MLITATILAKNEEDNIKACIQSVKFCEEILVIDDNSTDKTAKIAKTLGAKVFTRDLQSDFAAQRNYALGIAKGKWVIFVDADERVSPSLRSEIIQLTNNPILNKSGYYLKRVDSIWGKELKFGETGTVKLLRLARRDAGKWRRKVHEVWEVDGTTGTLVNSLNHYPHPTVENYLRDINIYSTFHSEANEMEGKISSILTIITWPLGKFVYNWFFKRGLKDNNPGFVVAAMMSFSSYLAWSKQWLKQKKKK